MICETCGGTVTWRGPFSNLTHTECESCGRHNNQIVEQPDDEESDEGSTMTTTASQPNAAPSVHELKTDPAVFDAVARGDKTHEIRLNDRNFRVGDTLLLRETESTGAAMRSAPKLYPLAYTGRTATRAVSHIQTGYGLADGWCILSFRNAFPSVNRDAAAFIGWNDAIAEAAAIIQNKISQYDADLGKTDPETGTREYPGEGAAWVMEMDELADEILALKSAAPALPEPAAAQGVGND